MKEKLILTDVDGCLLEWNDAFESYMVDAGYKRIPNTDHHYNLSWRFDASFEVVRKMVVQFNECQDIAHLHPLPGAVATVNRLVEHGFRFVCITSLSDAPEAKQYRTHNLINEFGNVFDDIICLPVGASKSHILENWGGTGLFWLEDHFTNAEAGHEVGLQPILFETAYNSHLTTDLFPRTSLHTPWADVERIVTEEYSLLEVA